MNASGRIGFSALCPLLADFERDAAMPLAMSVEFAPEHFQLFDLAEVVREYAIYARPSQCEFFASNLRALANDLDFQASKTRIKDSEQ